MPGRYCRAGRSKMRTPPAETRQTRWWQPSSPSLSAAAGIEQEFSVASGAEDRAFDDPDHGPGGLGCDPGRGALAGVAMNLRVAHDAALADTLAADLELRLDERHQLGVLGGERQRRRQHHRKADEAR